MTSNHDIAHDIINDPLSFDCIYNSSSSQMCWFGHGWSGPFEIYLNVLGDGTIEIHDNKDEILTAESKQGSKMALKVTQAFQDLLQIVSIAKSTP